jgi:hypothetical protein
MVLTVQLPTWTANNSNEMNVTCVGCPIILQQRRDEEHGCAHQKWSYDHVSGFVFAFNASMDDQGNILHLTRNQLYAFELEITAANQANICSYTVYYDAISQPVCS